jgi:hypothetical protein
LAKNTTRYLLLIGRDDALLPERISFIYLLFFLSFSSQLGAVRFDRDLRAITTYLSSQTAFGDVREKFVRLQQIATLLNLDHVRPLLTHLHIGGVILMVAVRSGFFGFSRKIGRRRGRILQWFWDYVEVE